MGRFLAIEGADGAGKATCARGLAASLGALGLRATVVSFPRYADTVAGWALGEFLSGRLSRPVTPETAAVLYATDRMESRAHLETLAAENDVVVLDRYIASNVAYQAAKVEAPARAALAAWIVALETGALGVRPPDAAVYLDTPPDLARRLIAQKQQRDYTDDVYDVHERDVELQRGVRDAYHGLVADNVLGPWIRVRTTGSDGLRPPADIVAEVAGALAGMGWIDAGDRDVRQLAAAAMAPPA